MANTYTQIYLHIVFSVQNRICLIPKEKKEELHKYITGIVMQRSSKLICINSMPDHVHILIGYHPDKSLSELVRDIKAGSSKFINDNVWVRGKFHWQEGYGAFSYSRSQLSDVIRYIQNQEQHHVKKTFKEEYFDLLKKFEVEFDEKYLFAWIEAEQQVAPTELNS